MNVPISGKQFDGEIWLSDETPDHRILLHCQSSRLFPNGDFMPSDSLDPSDPSFHAAQLVHIWAGLPERNEDELAWAQAYLKQWPEGPQADSDSLQAQKEFNGAFARAREELGAGLPLLDQMSKGELRAEIERMKAKLAECTPESPMAQAIQLRIGMAELLLDMDQEE